MAQRHEKRGRAPLDTHARHAVAPERILRYLPRELHNTPAGAARLAAARATIITYLPRCIARRVLVERLESPWLRRADGSLLFADLSGSTALAEQLSTLGREGIEIVTDFLNGIFDTMIQVIQQHDGDLVSFGGDALLVFFDDANHPRTAARAALALQQALHGFVREVAGVGIFPMHLHIGVESGPVTFITAGLSHALHYTALGPTVNDVSRAEGLAGPEEVVVGPRAWESLAPIARGETVAPGFLRLTAVAPPAGDAAAGAPALPEVAALPDLVDDLDRITPYIPPVLLDRILAAPESPRVEADLRPVTVIFAQTVGLEAIVEQLAPALAAQAIQVYMAQMQVAIEQFGGVVNKLDVADEGVKLVAIFGAPTAYEDHAERAARAALLMRDQVAAVNREIAQIGGAGAPSLRQRIGINLGSVFAGNVGSAERKEYTVMGDAVNVAARVMSKAGWGEAWCSELTMRAIETRMICESRGQTTLKGKAEPIDLFLLREERDPLAAALASYRAMRPLVGRAEELAWLRAQMAAALDGDGRAVRIVGDAGIGKSRLTAALVGDALERGVRVISAACFSYTAGIPYAAWGEWLKEVCGIVSGDSDEVRARKLGNQLLLLGVGMDEWLPLLADLVRLDVADNRLTRGLDPQLRQMRRFELLEQLLLRAAGSGPLLVLFEDIHWADPISLDLWRRVAARIAGRTALLVGVHRPTPLLSAESDTAQVLELRELAPDESYNMLTALAGDLELPDTLRRQIVDRAAGNPLFLGELLHAVQEQATQARSATAAVIDQLPDSLNGLLLSRIDGLDPNSRGVLRVASVIGQRIPFGVMQSIHDADQQALLRNFTRLDAADITVFERAEPERVHVFRHALMQEVAYQSMLYARRRELHGKIGEYLERRYADDLDDYYGLLAHHYRLSDRRDKAIAYLLKAGHAARGDYANEEALQYYSWALEALAGAEDDPRSWEAHDALGDVYATIGRYDDALAQHAAIIAAPGVSAEAARRAHLKRGNVLEKQAQFVAALAALEQAMALARSGAEGISPVAIPLICADVGLVRQRRGEYDLAIAACEEGLAAMPQGARSIEADSVEARLHTTLGAIYGMRGDYPRSRHHFERSLAVREAIDDLPGIASSHNNLGYLWQLQAEYERAIEHYRVAREVAQKINMRYALVHAAGNEAYALLSLGDLGAAEARCVEGLALSRSLNTQQTTAQLLTTLGIIYYNRGAYERALESHEEALHLNRALGSAHQEANALINIAVTLAALGRAAEAAEAAERTLAQAEALNAQLLRAEAHNALAEAALLRGAAQAAHANAGIAAELSRTIGSKLDLGIALRLQGQAAAALGRAFATPFEESIALFTETKNRFETARSQAAYGAALAEAGNEIAAGAYLEAAQEAFIRMGADGELRRLRRAAERSR
jgi:class 3 adenylate cyclase/tetratricopeptide (TPR) repeat protein